MKKTIGTSPRVKVLLLVLGHFMNDIHGNFLPTFLPSLIERLGLSLGQAGLLTSLPGVLHVSFQPMLGYFSDLYAKPLMIIVGPVLTAAGASLIPISTNYGLAFFFTGMWGIGSACFHPQGLGATGYLSTPENISFNISLFQMGGAFGVTMSSLYAAFLATIFGFEWMPLVCILPVAALGTAYFFLIPNLHPEGGNKKQPDGLFRTIKKIFLSIWPVWTIAFTRDISIHSIRFLVPVIVASKGGTIAQIGFILFVLNLTKSFLTVFVARISDRLGRKKVLAATLLFGPLLMAPSVITEGLLSMILLVSGFSIIGCSLPLTASIAQEKAPNSRSTASSLIMGVSYGLSGIMMTPAGAIADIIGPKITLLGAVCLPLFPLVSLWTSKKVDI